MFFQANRYLNRVNVESVADIDTALLNSLSQWCWERFYPSISDCLAKTPRRAAGGIDLVSLFTLSIKDITIYHEKINDSDLYAKT